MTDRQFEKTISRIIKFIPIILGLAVVSNIFGNESKITEFYREKVVFTPYNIVGLIMILCALGGGWIGRKNGSLLFKVVTFLLSSISYFSFIANFVNFFNAQENVVEDKANYGFNWVNIIVIALIVIFAILLVAGIIKLINFIREERKQNVTECEPNVLLNEENVNLEQIKQQEEQILKAIKNKIEYKIANNVCPNCNGELKKKQNRINDSWFIGCENYFSGINCRFTCDYKVYKKYEELYAVEDEVLLEKYRNGQIKIDLN